MRTTTTRFLAGCLLLTLLGCGGSGEPTKDNSSGDAPARDSSKKTPKATPKLPPPPQSLVEAWEAAGATVARLEPNRWGENTFNHRRVPEKAEEILAFYFAKDAFNADVVRKLEEPEQGYALYLDQASDKEMEGLDKLSNLQVLHLLRVQNLSDAGLKKIARIKDLTELMITRDTEEDPEQKPKTITQNGLSALSGSRTLARLALHNYKEFNDGVLDHISGIKGLTHLTLADMAVGDKGLKGLSKLKNLTHLNLSATATGDLKEIEGLNKLVVLRVANCNRLGDAAMNSILKLTNLQQLELASTAVTDASVKKLGALKQLRGLSLEGCKNVNIEEQFGTLRKENINLYRVK